MNDVTVHKYIVVDSEGQDVDLSIYQGKVLLIVNTASKCGLTPQYEGLEQLQQAYQENGFTVLGFPCNQFLGQEPGSDAEIQAFCKTKFQISFPVFGKIEVNGSNTHPLYEYLKRKAPGLFGSKKIKWNFTKFLVDPNGKVIRRYGPNVLPEDIEQDIAGALGATSTARSGRAKANLATSTSS
ncbi:MAG: glutathione peroxidase [Myxococcota bacterium]|nr:glutathione peroxidase [Myxococcota bacterium]